MTIYTACFIGCVIGSTTPFSELGWINVDIEADSEAEANSLLYQSHENISRLFWLWPGKQTVKEFRPCDHRRIINGRLAEVYVSTYNGHSWCQTDCCHFDVERIKAEHLANEAFMSNYGRTS